MVKLVFFLLASFPSWHIFKRSQGQLRVFVTIYKGKFTRGRKSKEAGPHRGQAGRLGAQ